MGNIIRNNRRVGDSSAFRELQKSFSERHEALKKHVSEKHKDALSFLKTYPTQMVAGVMGGVMMMGHPGLTLPAQSFNTTNSTLSANAKPLNPSAFVIADLASVLPDEVGELSPEEEKQVSEVLTRTYEVPVSAELDGIKLNRSYGFIGAEQHLARYPGDTMASHFTNQQDSEKYYSSGMAPSLGAWGYFTPSAQQMTQNDIDKEKYYIAVQTFLAPGFHDNVRKYIIFFKHRKMIVVNPENGKAMVVVIGDAGPGASTGKHLGGSPEVMKYLERVDGKQKGPVLYYFIDDPEDKIPLGPIEPSKNSNI